VQEFLETVLLDSSATNNTMARMRKDKGQPLTQTKTKNHPKKSFSNKPIPKENILALGGSQADVDLLKDLDENEASGSANTDVSLSFSLFCYNSLFY